MLFYNCLIITQSYDNYMSDIFKELQAKANTEKQARECPYS